MNRAQWLEEDCERLTDPALYTNEPALAYLRIKKGHILPPDKQPILRELAAWRESTARQHDLPRNWVLRDAVLLELARAAPRTMEQLRRICGPDHAVHAKWGESLLTAIAKGQSTQPVHLWQEPRRLSAEEKHMREEMLAQIATVAEQHGISPSAITSKNEIKQLILGNPPASLLRGWRYHVVGKVLLSRGSGAAAEPSGNDNPPADERRGTTDRGQPE